MNDLGDESIVLQDRDDGQHFLIRPVEKMSIEDYFNVMKRLATVTRGEFWELDSVAKMAIRLNYPTGVVASYVR